MEEEFMILDAHQYAQSTNRSKNNIIFRIQWKKTGQIAFMHYEIAKRKCPQMLVEYFTARLMPVSMNQQCSNSCSSIIDQPSSFSPLVKNGERLAGKQKNQVQAYFNRCEKCKFQQKKFIDYDEYLQHAEPQRMSVFFKRQVLSQSASDKN